MIDQFLQITPQLHGVDFSKTLYMSYPENIFGTCHLMKSLTKKQHASKNQKLISDILLTILRKIYY